MPKPSEPGSTFRIPDVLPLLRLENRVVFPYIIVPLSVTDERGIRAIDRALADDRIVLLVPQHGGTGEASEPDEPYGVGTAALVMRMLKLPDGRVKVLVQGLARARVERLTRTEPYLEAQIQPLGERESRGDSLETEALVRTVKESLERVVHLGRGISPEVMMIAGNLDDPGRLADLAASNLDLRVEDAQRILETTSPLRRLRIVGRLLSREIRLLEVQQEIATQVQGEMDRNQKEYYLRQQIKAIREELGEGDDLGREIAAYRRRAQAKGLPPPAREEFETQLRRLARTHPESAEAGVIRTHLDWFVDLPWSTESSDHLDLERARTVLDRDHHGLEPVKERILELLAVRKLNPESKGPILCFVGPPGVGKTSLGRSIAEALGRRFVRISLGGVRDEAEIRGHRRTYVGALPGRILQGLRQAGTGNPVFMLDEIDKLGADVRGDPASALLEVLDPEQNSTFRDHYLGLPYDLSRVLFITTANLLEPIRPAFLDRMEVIRLSGYSTEEKLVIARRHLVPRQRAAHGLASRHIRFRTGALRRIVRDYTREAGLRQLEREIAAICRKVAVRVAHGEEGLETITAGTVEAMLGPARHFSEEVLDRPRVGVATGLAWTSAGGDLLLVEVVSTPGEGKLRLTGQLGEVMRESAQAALTVARRRALDQGAQPERLAEIDLHVHVPAGSIPKDGPSAGITIATALTSVLTGRPVDHRVAMTGEITLRGVVLPIGGLKEKVLAARQAGLRCVVLPRLNQRDLAEIPEELRRGMEFCFAESIEDVLSRALLDPPRP